MRLLDLMHMTKACMSLAASVALHGQDRIWAALAGEVKHTFVLATMKPRFEPITNLVSRS